MTYLAMFDCLYCGDRGLVDGPCPMCMRKSVGWWARFWSDIKIVGKEEFGRKCCARCGSTDFMFVGDFSRSPCEKENDNDYRR